MSHRFRFTYWCSRTFILVLVLAAGACNGGPQAAVKQPLVVGATRGATTIDIYGTWVLTNDPLGRMPKIWRYQFQYVRSGTTVYANGTTSGPVLQSLDAGTVTWTTAPGTLAMVMGTPAPSPDSNGMAFVTLRFGPPGQGTATLSVGITYGGGAGTDSTRFEVDRFAP